MPPSPPGLSSASPVRSGSDSKILSCVGKSFGSTSRKDCGTLKTCSARVVLSMIFTDASNEKKLGMLSTPSGEPRLAATSRFSRPAMPGFLTLSVESTGARSTISRPVTRPLSPSALTEPPAVMKSSNFVVVRRMKKPPLSSNQTFDGSLGSVSFAPPTISKATERGCSSYVRSSVRTT